MTTEREFVPAHGLSLVIGPMSDFHVKGRFIVQHPDDDFAVVRRALVDFIPVGNATV